MLTKQKVLARLKQIGSEQLGVKRHQITEQSTWAQLGADSLDRLAVSHAIEDAFTVDIPHIIGEHLNTIGQTLDYVLQQAALQGNGSAKKYQVQIVATNRQWNEMCKVRTEVFTAEHKVKFKPLPGPGEKGVWHFLVREAEQAIATLSVVDTTADRELIHRYLLPFGDIDRAARYAQLAILKPYRGRAISRNLIETAEAVAIRPNKFELEWLIFPAAYLRTSVLTRCLGFTAEPHCLHTEFGPCHVLVRHSPMWMNSLDDSLPVIDTCPI
jgi:acyl carrier protein